MANRIIITGHPYAGKTTLARTMDLPIYSTDTIEQCRIAYNNVTYLPGLVPKEYVSEYIIENWFNKPKFIIEGVAAVRALRRWARMYPRVMPCDKIIFLRNNSPFERHISMTKAIDTIWDEISSTFARITEYK